MSSLHRAVQCEGRDCSVEGTLVVGALDSEKGNNIAALALILMRPQPCKHGVLWQLPEAAAPSSCVPCMPASRVQRCVRRRAELSVSMKPACEGPRAKDAVNAVLESCIKDTAPFHRHP